MTLIIQIALGILLGYLLIEHRSRLGEWAWVALRAVLWLAALAAAFAAVVYISSSVGGAIATAPEWLGSLWDSTKRLLLVAVVMSVMVTGAYGFILLVRKLVARWFRLPDDMYLYTALGVINILMIWPADLYLRSHPVLGELYRSADLWSRENGFSDSVEGMLSFSLTLWPWPVIWIARRFGVDFASPHAVDATAQHSFPPEELEAKNQTTTGD